MLHSEGSEIERAALSYAERGWSVIPAEPRGKRPVVAWQEFQRRIATADEIADWFGRWPDANVAVVTGALSGVVVLDIDPRHGGTASLSRLEIAHGPLPQTLEALTGGGGRHLYFRHPGGLVRNRVGLAPGVDVRGDGGCVVAPPSVHPSGKRYAWVASHGPEDSPPARAPDWLLRQLGDGPGHGGPTRKEPT
jgi:hypothetical protein